ncbi:MAG: DUF1028 domain-containing protein [Rhodothermaceae bacterium]|nr:DUF1028 domain-containing protein [Rhodothermaceae bacterium]
MPTRRRLALLLLPALALAFVLLRPEVPPATDAEGNPLVSTFSIVAYDAETGELGVAVQSKFPNVRAVVPWLEAGVGAVATQSFAELDYGIKGLELMRHGATAEQALRIVLQHDDDRESRQVGIVDAHGNAATWTGTEAFAWRGGRVGQEMGESMPADAGTVVTGFHYTAQGNILVSQETVDAMAETFEQTTGSLADRLLAALLAGGAAGGDKRGEQSAALIVVREGAGYDGDDRIVDISVYDHETPLAELARLYTLNNLYFTDSRPENMIPVTPEIARELQEIWITRGFYDGPADGVVDAEFQQLLTDYMGWENYDLRIDEVADVNLAADETLMIDHEVLDDMRAVFREGRYR